MKLEQLRTFIAVLEHRSFSRAADAVGVSQSTVSFHIAQLEDATGARLLDRHPGAACATEQGEVLERYARRMLAMASEAMLRLHEAEAVPTGTLVVAASTIVAEHLMPPMLRNFRLACPNVSVTVEVFDSRAALERLRAQRCELAFVGSPARERRFDSTPFAHDDIVLVGSPNAVRTIDQPAALAALPLVLREVGSGTRAAVADLLAEAELDRADIVVVGSTQAARRCVLEGLGYSFISRYAIADDVRGRRMRVVELAGTPLRRRFHAVRLHAQTPTAAARAFHALVTEPLPAPL